MAPEVLESISRLHNFCNNMRSHDLCENVGKTVPFNTSPLGWGCIPTVETLVPPSVPGSSHIHDTIVSMVSQIGFGCQAHNIVRHREELHEINLI